VKIITPVETRWNSTLMMIRSVIHLRVPLELIRDSPKDRKENFKLVDAIPDAEDFDLLEKVVPLLSKFEAVSEFLSADQHITIAYCLSKLTYLSHTLFSVKTTTKGEANRPIRELAEVIIE
jgi:hypothetical protein